MHVVSARGAGRPVLLLHGSPSAPGMFEPLVRALEPEHRVIVGALPGYAGSAPLAPYTLEALHTGIETALARESDAPWTLVGFSAGSYHVLSLGLRARVKLGRLVTLGGLPGFGPELAAEYRGLPEAIRAGALPPETFPPRMLSAPYLAAHPEARELVGSWLAETTLDVLADELRAIIEGPDLLPRLSALAMPLLARVGELDAVTPVAWSEAIAAAAPRALLEVVPGSGHALLVEDAPATCASIRRFLAGC
ncbi:MAG TPA: alpha/beta hydrolase [Polyangiaceae bacterium]